MSKAERRRFALECGAEANYVQLFNAIAAQTEYDEAAIKAQFADAAFVRNFSVAKAYLMQRILHVLRTPQEPISIEMAQRRALDDIEVLHAKGLYHQADHILGTALRLAQLHDLPSQEAELLKWRRRLVNLQPGKGRLAQLAQIDLEEADALRRLSEESALRAIRAQVQSIALEQIDLRLPENSGRLKALMADPVLSQSPLAFRFHARTAYHQIHATVARLHANTAEVLEHFRAILKVWQEAIVHQKEHPHQYLNALASFLDACIRAHIFEGFHENLALLHALPDPDANFRAQAFYLGHHLELRYAISTGEFQHAMRRTGLIEEGLQRHAKFLNPGVVITFLYNLAVLHFLAQDYPIAIRFINRILNQGTTSIRQDIFDAARVLELASHFSLGNFDLLESLLRSMSRRLRLHPRENAFEKVVVKGLRKLMDAPLSLHKAIFSEIDEELEAVPGAAFLAGREELLLWLRANLLGQTPAELIQNTGKSV